MSFTIEIADHRQAPADHARLKAAARAVFDEAKVPGAELSIAIVDDESMQQLNRQYLAHDYPTDVLSFLLEQNEESGRLEGQIIVSWEFASREAPRYGWTTDDELLLYVIHGCLHLVGYDDTTPEDQIAMRAAEARHLKTLGLQSGERDKPSAGPL